MADYGQQNLAHALEGTCTDPDCEIHNPEVGYSEEVITLTDVAFFYAGAVTLADLIANARPEGELDVEDYLEAAINIALAELRDQHIPTPR